MEIGQKIWCYKYDSNYNLTEYEAVVKSAAASSRNSEFLLCTTVEGGRLIKPGFDEGSLYMRCLWLREPNMNKARKIVAEHLWFKKEDMRSEISKLESAHKSLLKGIK